MMLYMQQYQFHHDQFAEDLEAIKKGFFGFLKSFGPSPKKIVDRPIGIFEEINIRFRLSLVEMGISKVIRSAMLLIVGIFVYFVLFRNADVWFKFIIGFGFLSYYIWLFMPHLVTDGKFTIEKGFVVGKPIDKTSGYLIMVHNARLGAQSGIAERVSKLFGSKEKS